LHLQLQLLITSLGPIGFSAGAANAQGWAHCIGSCFCQWPCLGLLFSLRAAADALEWVLSLQLLLPMDLLGPIVYAAAAADGFIWAHCFSERCWPYPRVGPLQLCKQLPMASLGPIMFPAGAANALGRALLRRSALAMSIGSYYILYIVATKHC